MTKFNQYLMKFCKQNTYIIKLKMHKNPLKNSIKKHTHRMTITKITQFTTSKTLSNCKNFVYFDSICFPTYKVRFQYLHHGIRFDK